MKYKNYLVEDYLGSKDISFWKNPITYILFSCASCHSRNNGRFLKEYRPASKNRRVIENESKRTIRL